MSTEIIDHTWSETMYDHLNGKDLLNLGSNFCYTLFKLSCKAF